MKLRGGQWVSDNSDAMALAAALNTSTTAQLKVEEPTRRLLRYARNDEPRSSTAEIESRTLVRAQDSYAHT